MLEDMTRCVMNIESKYKDTDEERPVMKQGNLKTETNETDQSSVQRPGRFSQRTLEEPGSPRQETFRPAATHRVTTDRLTTDSNFIKKYEERSLEAIKQS